MSNNQLVDQQTMDLQLLIIDKWFKAQIAKTYCLQFLTFEYFLVLFLCDSKMSILEWVTLDSTIHQENNL